MVLSCVDFEKWERGEIVVDNSVLKGVLDSGLGVSQGSRTTQADEGEITEKYNPDLQITEYNRAQLRWPDKFKQLIT